MNTVLGKPNRFRFKFSKISVQILFLCLTLSISACGTDNTGKALNIKDDTNGNGSNSGIQNPSNTGPKISANNQFVLLQNNKAQVEFSASIIDDGNINKNDISWTQISGSPVSDLQQISPTRLRFKMPSVSEQKSFARVQFKFNVKDSIGRESFLNFTAVYYTKQRRQSENRKPYISPIQTISATDLSVIRVPTIEIKDHDGWIQSIKWQQLSGPDVQLFKTDEPTLVLRLPEQGDDDPDIVQLVFQITVTDNQGASSSQLLTLNSFKDIDAIRLPSQITGTVSFEQPDINPINNQLDMNTLHMIPAAGVIVELRNGDNTIETTTTDSYGNYKFTRPELAENKTASVRVVSEMKSGISSVKVLNAQRFLDNNKESEVYTLDGESIPLSEDKVNEVFKKTLIEFENGNSISGISPWIANFTITAIDRNSGPFAILNTIRKVQESLLSHWDPSLQFPDLEVYWDTNYKPGGSFYNREGYIVINSDSENDEDQYDPMIIGHEYGHYFQDHFSRSESLGGQHIIAEHLDMTVAFDEGFATAFAGMALGESVYRDASVRGGFAIDIESPDLSTKGWYSENSVSSIIWDLFDTQDDGDDTMNISMAEILNVMRDDIPKVDSKVTMHSFLTSIMSKNQSLRDESSNLLQEHGYNVFTLDIWGTNSTDDAGNPDILPIYKQINPDGESVEVCSIDDFMNANFNYNKLGAWQYLRLTISPEQAGSYIIEAQADFGRDPDFIVFKRGIRIAEDTTSGNTESVSSILDAGDYVIQISDAFNVTFPLGKSCMQVSVTKQ